MTERYAHSLVENIRNRFSNSLPVLNAFNIFDPLALPDRSAESFKEYGISEIEILTGHFFKCEGRKRRRPEGRINLGMEEVQVQTTSAEEQNSSARVEPREKLDFFYPS